MPTLDQHESSKYSKLIYIGDTSTGKTGSLASLVLAGYTLRILDLDNGLDSLKFYGRQLGADLSHVIYETHRDEYKASKAGPILKGGPKAFTAGLTTLTEWSEIEDENSFTVIDTFGTFGKQAFEWAKGMNPTAKDPRQWYGTAQKALEDTLALLTGPNYKQNVIVISHVNYKELVEGVNKGYVSSIGTALGPSIPKYFNTMLLAEAIGSGTNVKRKIKTTPTGVIDLKTPNPDIEASYDLATGLASIVAKLKEG